MTDYYAVLEIPRDADDNTIKKAYKTMAMRWHPDRNPNNKKVASDKFKEVSEAYEVLSDPNKRTIYDRYGADGLRNGGGDNNGSGGVRFSDADDIFRQFFGAFGNGGGGPFGGFGATPMEDDDPFGGFGMGGMGGMPSFGRGFGGMGGGLRGGGMPSRAPTKDALIKRNVECTLEEIFTGVTKRLKITRQVTDEYGRQTTSEKVLTIEVKPGWKAGTKVTFPNEGDERPGTTPADIEFAIVEKPHPTFTRDGNHLTITATITLKQALMGGRTRVATLDGRALDVTFESVTPSSVITLPGQGMPISKQAATGARGDMHVNFEIVFPTLSSSQKDAIGEIL